MSSPLGKSVFVYGLAFAVAGVTPFVLLPLLTQHLSPEQFGQATSFLVLAAMLSNFAGLSAHGFASVRWFKIEREEFRGLATSALATSTVMHGLTALGVWALQSPLSHATALPLPAMLLAVGAAWAINLNLTALAIFQSSGRPALYLRSRVVQATCELGLCLAWLVWLVPDAQARALTFTAAVAAAALVGLARCVRDGHLGGGLESRHARALLTFGLPMLPHIVAGSAVTYLDRLVVTSLLGVQSLGLYMAAMQIGMVVVALIEPLNKALAPWLFEQLARDDRHVRRMIVRRTYQLYAGLVLFGVLFTLLAQTLFESIVGDRYAAARPLIPWMVAGFVLQGLYYGVVNYLFYAERTGRLSVVSAITASAGLGASYALTSAYGLAGAAASFALNNLLLFSLVWLVASRAVPMPWWPWRR